MKLTFLSKIVVIGSLSALASPAIQAMEKETKETPPKNQETSHKLYSWGNNVYFFGPKSPDPETENLIAEIKDFFTNIAPRTDKNSSAQESATEQKSPKRNVADVNEAEDKNPKVPRQKIDFSVPNITTSTPMHGNIDAQDAQGNTVLMSAVNTESLSLVESLLKKGANPHIKNNTGKTALDFAHSSEMRTLLTRYGTVDLETCIKYLEGKYEGAKEMIERYLQEGGNINAQRSGNYGGTLLMWAVVENLPEIVIFLLEKGADINFRILSGQTALQCVSLSENVATSALRIAIVEILLAHHANPNMQNDLGDTILMEAVGHAHNSAEGAEFCKKIIQILLDHRADPNIKNHAGKTALECCSDPAIRNLLLEHGAIAESEKKAPDASMSSAEFNEEENQPDSSEDSSTSKDSTSDESAGSSKDSSTSKGSTSDESESSSNSNWQNLSKSALNTIKTLIKTSGNINVQDGLGNTALIIAVATDSLDEVKEFIEKGANPNIRNNLGQTALMLCTNPEICTLLLDNGASPNIVDHDHWTAPMYLCNRCPVIVDLTDNTLIKDYGKIITLLRNAHANFCLRNKDGETAFDLLFNLCANAKCHTIPKLFLNLCNNAESHEMPKNEISIAEEPVDNTLEYNKIMLQLKKMRKSIKEDHQVKSTVHFGLYFSHLFSAFIKKNAPARPAPGNATLVNCMYQKNIAGIEQYLQDGGDINAQNELGETALMKAVHNSTQMTKFLLEKGAKPNLRDHAGKTALMHLAQCGDWLVDSIAAAQLLVDYGADVNLQCTNGETALIFAASKLPDMVKFLLEHNAQPNLHNVHDMTALNRALQIKNPELSCEITKLLLDAGANPSPFNAFCARLRYFMHARPSLEGQNEKQHAEISEQLKMLSTLLSFAEKKASESAEDHAWIQANKDDLDKIKHKIEDAAQQRRFVEKLIGDIYMGDLAMNDLAGLEQHLDTGGNVNIQVDNRTALMCAAGLGQPDMVALLLKRGADPNIQNIWGITALMCTRDPVTCKLLLEAGADPNIQDNNGLTALAYLATSGKGQIETCAIAQLLLDKGANLMLKDKEGQTAFARCKAGTPLSDLLRIEGQDSKPTPEVYQNTQQMRLLIENLNKNNFEGIEKDLQNISDINMQDCDGHTLLMHAVDGEWPDFVEYLLAHGADPNIKNISGKTALMLCPHNLEICKLLLEAGADPNMQNNDGWTALMNFSLKDNSVCTWQIVQLLLNKGADITLKEKDGLTVLNLLELGVIESPEITSLLRAHEQALKNLKKNN